MQIHIHPDSLTLGQSAAREAATALRMALAERGEAALILATGASQFAMLDALVHEPAVAWRRVTVFHLDEYIGLPETHPASFRRYLRERFLSRVPGVRAFHAVQGDAPDAGAECRRLGELIAATTVEVALIGIGENGHLAFNDPPADFTSETPYLVVDLDEACRRQQLGEGWFPTLDAVPRQAISMSIRQIMRAQRLIVSVPDRRKAEAVHHAVDGPLTPWLPASILRDHPACTLHLDRDSAALLDGETGCAI